MRSARLNAIGILNASVKLALRVASPWMGVLWLTALPHRLLQLYFVCQLVLLTEPQFYGYYLWRLAAIVFAAFVVSIYGRAVFIRACYFAQNSERDSKLEALKVPLSDFIPYLYTALIGEFFFYLTSITYIFWALFGGFCVIYSGLAAATSYGISGPKLLRAPLAPFKMMSSLPSIVAILGYSIVFFFGLIMAVINLYVLVLIALALGGSLLGTALPRWEYIFAPGAISIFPKQPLTYSLLLIGASMLIEPFWLAANVDLVQNVRARKSGEDLQLWFRDIQNEAAR